MKQQTFIVKVYKGAKMLTFERFSYKRPETILKKYRDLYKNNKSGLWELFWRDYLAADKITITATPDGYHETETVVEMNSKEFLQFEEA